MREEVGPTKGGSGGWDWRAGQEGEPRGRAKRVGLEAKKVDQEDGPRWWAQKLTRTYT